MRIAAAFSFASLVVTLAAKVALAHPPPEIAYDEPKSWRDDRSFFEWSSWLRLAYAVENEPVVGPTPVNGTVARGSAGTPADISRTHALDTAAFDGGIGLDVTLPIPTQRVRFGPWVELRPTGVFSGGELSIAGKMLDMFMYEGERVYTLRAGASTKDVTASLSFGYRCPWKLFGSNAGGMSRYMIGARLVATGTRSVDDPKDWAVSFGLEFEPVGALRYIGAIKSWY